MPGLDAMVWQREYDEARQMYGIASATAEQAAESRIAFYRRTDNAASIYEKLPATQESQAALTMHALNGASAKAVWVMQKTCCWKLPKVPTASGDPPHGAIAAAHWRVVRCGQVTKSAPMRWPPNIS